MPEQSGLELNLPPMNGAQWLGLLRRGVANNVSNATTFPQSITLRTPALTLGGQQWNNLSIVSQPQASGSLIGSTGAGDQWDTDAARQCAVAGCDSLSLLQSVKHRAQR